MAVQGLHPTMPKRPMRGGVRLQSQRVSPSPALPEEENAGEAKTDDTEPRPGHGCLSIEAYSGAERVECRHQELAPGDRCPVCGIGWLYSLPPGRDLRINGQALLSAIRYDVEKLRCSACGERFTATLPEEAGAEKYHPSARSALALSRYFLGVPFYRLEAYQALVGVPVPDATQWNQVERVADCAYPVFDYSETKIRLLSRLPKSSEQFVWLNRTHREWETQLTRSGIAPSIRFESS